MNTINVTVINPAATLETAPPVHINGRTYPYSYGKPVDLPEEAVAVLRRSGLEVIGNSEASAPETVSAPENDEVNPSPASEAPAGDGDAATGSTPGGEAGGGETAFEDTGFDPEEVITGTVDDVSKRLNALSFDQLAAVEAAELDREVPRVGVREAIERARKAFES